MEVLEVEVCKDALPAESSKVLGKAVRGEATTTTAASRTKVGLVYPWPLFDFGTPQCWPSSKPSHHRFLLAVEPLLELIKRFVCATRAEQRRGGQCRADGTKEGSESEL